MKLLEIENKAVSEIKRLMAKYGLNQLEVAMHTQIHAPRLSEIFANKRRVTPDADLRLCKFFKLKDGHFLQLQNLYDLEKSRMKIADRLDNIRTVDEIVRGVS